MFVLQPIVDCVVCTAAIFGGEVLSYATIKWIESRSNPKQKTDEAQRKKDDAQKWKDEAERLEAALDPTKKLMDKVRKQAEELIRLQSGVGDVQLSDREAILATKLVDPRKIRTTWRDIAGLDEVVAGLKDTVLLLVQKKHLIGGSRMLRLPKGVLLHGPPGCGKTLIAAATAKEAGFPFINLQASTLTDKWHGETEKMVTALFTLAAKLQPCIIFIDEIDSLLRSRSSDESDCTAKLKGLFLSLWDGLDTDDNQVIIMGATNRPQDIDSAILRRMPATFEITLPSRTEREKILKVHLEDEKVDPSLDLCEASKQTKGFSGSDLKEVCRLATMLCLRDSVESLRPIQQADLQKAITGVKERKARIRGNRENSDAYRHKSDRERSPSSSRRSSRSSSRRMRRKVPY